MKPTVQIISKFNLNAGSKVDNNSNDTSKALKITEEEKPSIIFLEYEIAKNNTELFIKSLLNESPNSRVILLGENLSDNTILDCLLCGLYGYVDIKDINPLFSKVVKLVGHGEAWISRRLVGLFMEKFRDNHRYCPQS
ncbi:MAG: hypothetical protein GQ581_09075 [Methyloprofundus sp.]|nr:hypothetical protein [Methyloprofundus sp.]